jgi:ATP-binding cassette, subfamily B, bacterial HlyB/CyaB
VVIGSPKKGIKSINSGQFAWAVGSLCALHKRPFDAELLLSQFPPPYSDASLISAIRAVGLRVKPSRSAASNFGVCPTPFLAWVNPQTVEVSTETGAANDNHLTHEFVLIAKADATEISYFNSGSNQMQVQPIEAFSRRFEGEIFLVQNEAPALTDPDSHKLTSGVSAAQPFGFKWFLPELLKHKSGWRDVLGASLVLQLLSLGLPLFTQAIIDKVVVHRTESTLIALGVGMLLFVGFTALLTWVRQYLVLHTGNRVDAVLGSSVLEHLFKLPLRYFEHRPTGVVAARLHGIETIREFVSSAAVSLVLDIPFLLIGVGVMFFYSVPLTLLVLGILSIIALLSFAIAPIFQSRLNEQFLLGARNQAFVTEYVGGLETVKSLQLEPQIKAKYGDYLSAYLQSGFRTKQIANTYGVVANTLEQIMTMLVLIVGAWIVMHPALVSASGGGQSSMLGGLFASEGVFTIGMLVAFQMFSSKLSQPVLRIVGLWQQFQQARLSVERLGDLMNAPAEPYSLTPNRAARGHGRIEMQDVAFRYADGLPLLYERLSLCIEPGKTIAIMGPSGAGKSTLAKLLQGFYWPSSGQIKVDGIDTRNFSANELRSYFGVVPQETVLFSGTVYDNVSMANPHATFEQTVQACKMAEIHETIERLPKGYQTEIGERGAGLSGGQKQRLAIARALLKNPKVLIFDEATSALDAQTSESFAATINKLRGKVTMIFITHALPKALVVDETFLLKGGD